MLFSSIVRVMSPARLAFPAFGLGLVAVFISWVAAPASAQVPPVVPGFPNVPQTPGALLSNLEAPNQGRTAIIAYHDGVLFTVPELPSSEPGSDFQVRTWDLADPANPVELAQHGISPMPINAHGYFKSGDYLVLGSNWPPESPWSWRADPSGPPVRTEFPDHQGAGVRGQLFQPWFVGDTYWSYGEVSGDATIERDGVVLASWDHLGLTGVVGHPFLLGDLLIFASDQSRTGVATYDVSDPTNPVLLDVLKTGGPGGYWPEIWGGDGKLYLVFPYRSEGNGMRVVDATDPTDLRFVADVPLPGDAAMYAQMQDEYTFIGGHKIDLRTFESVLFFDGANVTRPDGQVGVDTSQFALPLGNLLVTGGIGPNQGMAVWAHQAAPDTRGPSVGFHIPQAGRTGYPVGAPISLLIHETLETPTLVNGTTFLVRPLGGSPIDGRLTFSFDDVLTFTPSAPLAADTTYEVVLPAGGIRDAAGNGIDGYSFTFSTGSSVGGNQAPRVDALTASVYPAAPGQTVTLTAAVTEPDGDPIEVRFDFGDGTPKTTWSTQATTSHAYAAPGHYRAAVQVRDPAGQIASGGATVTVLVPPTGPRPSASAPIACDESGRRVYTVHPDGDTLAALDADSLAVVYEVATCEDPRSLTVVNDEIWVACRDDDRVRIHATATGAPLATVQLAYGAAPAGLVADPAGATVWMALQGRGEILPIDRATRAPGAAIALGPGLGEDSGPRALATDGSHLLATRFLSARDHAEVWDVDATTGALAATLRLPKFGGDENRDTTAAGRGVANQLVGLAMAPDGQSAWVVATKPNAERGLLTGGIDLDADNTVRNLIARLDLQTGTLSDAVDLDNSDSASALALSPLGDYLFVTLQGNDEVLVLDALRLDNSSGLGAFVTRLGTSSAPQGVCVDAVTQRTFVQNFLGRSVTVFETASLFRDGQVTPASHEILTAAVEPLPAIVASGKRVFYNAGDLRMSAEGYMSCATCHLDGGHDGRTWDFTGRGEGLRNTTSLRGREGTGQGNVHWSANFDEIQDFEGDVRFAFGGTGFLDDDDFAATADPLGPVKAGLSPELDALAAYVASLGRDSLPRSPWRTATGAPTAEALAGRAVFEGLGCDTCHAGPASTDSTLGTATLHDVGTLRTTSGGRLGGALPGIDTPTLRGLHATAPYFHDGSAPTLEDVFVVAGGVVIPAEGGTVGGGAGVTSQYVDLNNDDTVRGRAYVALDTAGANVTFTGVDGASGGVGALEVRYSTWSPRTPTAVVNGVAYPFTLEDPGNDPRWRHTNWRVARIEGVVYSAGPTNTIQIREDADFPNISIDEILVSTADDLAAAEPHHVAQTLSPADRDALLAFLRQLDGSDDLLAPTPLFADGFETGDATRWTLQVE